MCGRFTLISSLDLLKRIFKLNRGPLLPPNYNIAPTQPTAAIRLAPDREREMTAMRWGLIPSWAKDEKFSVKAINARCETVFENPAFRWAVRQRRCLVPTDGYYEWNKQGQTKRPYYIRLSDGASFAFAGIWETWSGPDEEPVESCSILTTEANSLLQPIHPRMPVILSPNDYEPWLDPARDTPDSLAPMLKPTPSEAMVFHPVHPRVNAHTHNDPQLIEPYHPPETGLLFE